LPAGLIALRSADESYCSPGARRLLVEVSRTIRLGQRPRTEGLGGTERIRVWKRLGTTTRRLGTTRRIWLGLRRLRLRQAHPSGTDGLHEEAGRPDDEAAVSGLRQEEVRGVRLQDLSRQGAAEDQVQDAERRAPQARL